MDLVVKNMPDTGVDITAVHVSMGNTSCSIPISIHPGEQYTISLPNLTTCQVGVTYNDKGIMITKTRPSPVSADNPTVTLMLMDGEPILI
jgi:hypothetical protein